MKQQIEDLKGKTFGLLTVKSFAGRWDERRHWECLCSCGKTLVCRENNLKTGGSKSCGCSRGAKLIKRNTKHNCSVRGKRSSAYRSWVAMKVRTSNANCTGAHNYVGRGIQMDPAWGDFKAFHADMGEPPSGYSLDRIDTNRGYNKNNCRWADRRTQNNNRRDNVQVQWKGKKWTVTALAEHVRMDRRLLYQRLYLGWTPERATSTPNQARK